eukprot:359138-Chlamydomonas_euryale.AAC.5
MERTASACTVRLRTLCFPICPRRGQSCLGQPGRSHRRLNLAGDAALWWDGRDREVRRCLHRRPPGKRSISTYKQRRRRTKGGRRETEGRACWRPGALMHATGGTHHEALHCVAARLHSHALISGCLHDSGGAAYEVHWCARQTLP